MMVAPAAIPHVQSRLCDVDWYRIYHSISRELCAAGQPYFSGIFFFFKKVRLVCEMSKDK